jgi:beta-lactamase regulating signal transducer with metallopeptidase domain
MNLLLHSLASEEWTHLVTALLHTLWLGGLAAGGLYFVLRVKVDPVKRYRWCAGALLAVVLGGIVAWAIVQRRPTAGLQPSATTAVAKAEPAGGAAAASPVVSAVPTPAPAAAVPPARWTPWLALGWLGGAAAMLARLGSVVAGAEKLRRSGRPLENGAVLRLIEEARRKLGLMRRIQVVVTERLTSPAVMGWLTPVLILPLSLVTTLPMGQMQLILLHELAHIRRRDYLVNLCQLLAESLLFFNPAVWWISRQIRQEREACCDAMAIALAGEPLQYARTLAQVAGRALAAAPAFGDRHNPSGLKDRIQRLLVPGYRPALPLTWRALAGSLGLGFVLLTLCALGTQWTVEAAAQLLTPQQRMDRIEKKMAEFGENPAANSNAGPVAVSVHLRTSDGSPLPRNKYVLIYALTHGSEGVYPGNVSEDGGATNSNVAPADEILIAVDFEGYAPALAGPFDGRVTNRIDAGELTLGRGFEISLRVSDADSGAAVTNAALHTQFFMLTGGQQFQHSRDVRPDAAGRVTLPLCTDQPLVVTVNAPGYEFIDKRFERLSAGRTLEVKLKRGQVFAGRVVDKATGEGLPGANLRVIHEKGAQSDMHYQWTDALRLLARTDEEGRFTVNQLRRDTKFWLGVSAPGHESVLLEAVPGTNDVTLKLGPELIVRGHVIGSLDGLQWHEGHPFLNRAYSEVIDGSSWGDWEFVPVHVTNGVATFQFTNQLAGPVTMSGGGYQEKREVAAPIEDWVVDLTASGKKEGPDAPTREVVFRFKHASGVPPRGALQVEIPPNSDKKQPWEHSAELEITNGEVRAEIAIGGRTGIVGTKHMMGYWFERFNLMSIQVTDAPGPQVVEIPLLPAGEIYAKARNADGTPAGGLMFGVRELIRAPGVDKGSLFIGDGDRMSDNAPRQWVSGPLPLGGTYQVGGWRGNMFCSSKPVKLTEANPDAEIEMQFPPGRTFDGVLLDPDGKPLPDAELETAFNPQENSSVGLKPVFTDQLGRFRMENMTPEIGEYSVRVNVPGAITETVKLDFGSQPQTIRLKRGRTLAGRVVQAGTGYAIPNTQVTAVDFDHLKLPMLRAQTDGDGHFEFKTMGEGNYTLSFGDGQLVPDKKYRADGRTNLVLAVKLYEWSKAKPKAIQ